MSIEYDYSDPEHRWPCLGPMTLAELDDEWLRCWKLLQSGDVRVKPWHFGGYMLSERVTDIAEEILDREFLRANHQRFVRGEASCDGAGFELWRFQMFMEQRS